MAGISTKNIPLGTKAPAFILSDVSTNRFFSLEDLKSDIATVIIFLSNICPFVNHIIDHLVKTSKDFTKQGVSFIGVNSNDAENYPLESPENMRKFVKQQDIPFPYLIDIDQDFARSINAVCTPEMFIFNKDLILVYHGQYDDSRPGNTLKTDGLDLKITLNNLLAGNAVDSLQKANHGNTIKWKLNIK